MNGTPVGGARPGTFLTIGREWKAGDELELRFPMPVIVNHGYHNSAIVERGPLVYSLKIGEQWHKLKQTGPAADYEVFPTTPWNYTLVLNQNNPAQSFRVEEKPIGKQPFSADGAPVAISLSARLPEWQLTNDSSAQLPVSPVTNKEPNETVFLIPYGSAKLRLTAMPCLNQ